MYTLKVKAGLPCPMSANIPYNGYSAALNAALEHVKLGAHCKILANATCETIWISDMAQRFGEV